MRTKIVNGDFYLKRRRFCFVNGKIFSAKFFSGKLRVIYNRGITYVVCPVTDKRPYEGIMIPIIEDYDSLEEIK